MSYKLSISIGDAMNVKKLEKKDLLKEMAIKNNAMSAFEDR